MANVLSEEKKQQVLALGRLGWPLRRIEQATGVRRETASAYLRAAGVPVRPPRGWGHAKPAKEVITDLPACPASCRSPAASACEPYRELIEQGLSLRRNAMAIWQELVDRHGFTAGYPSVMRFARKLRGAKTPEAHAVIVTEPGEEAQVDYGDGPMVRDATTGKYRRTRLFVMTLGCSRKSVRLLTWRSSSRIWCELHERAFRRLGGVTRTVVLDNLKEGVLAPDIYDPALNPLYRDVLAHYGVVALPCRVRHPDRKGKVESGIGHTQRTALKGLRFESLELAQQHLDDWDARWADTRIHGTTKRQVAAMFADERPHLLALPLEPFRYYQYGKRTVHLDGHVEVDGAYYSAPPGNIGRELLVQWDGLRVRLLELRTGELLREHRVHQRGRHRTHDDDKPHRTPSSTQAVLLRARASGTNTGALAAEIHRREGEAGVRRILGLLGLTKKYGPVAVDEASAMALSVGVPGYRFVRRYLESRPRPALTLRQVDPLIRDLTHYRDVIARMTKEER